MKYPKSTYQEHRLSGHPIYNTWRAMRARCYNKNAEQYKNYGGRGIMICDAWHDPIVFYHWAKDNNWQKGLTIERVNNDGNYEPSNCAWIPNTEQHKNQRYHQHYFLAFHLKTGRKIVNNSQLEFAKMYKISKSCVSTCIRNKRISAGGWRFFSLPDMRMIIA